MREGGGEGGCTGEEKCVFPRVNVLQDVEKRKAASCRSFESRYREAVGGVGPDLIERGRPYRFLDAPRNSGSSHIFRRR
jgi:hypothetical protein